MLHRLQISVLQREILKSLSHAAEGDRNEGWLSLTGLMAGSGRHMPHSVMGMMRRRGAYRRSIDKLQLQQLVEVKTLRDSNEARVAARITREGIHYLQLTAG